MCLKFLLSRRPNLKHLGAYVYRWYCGTFWLYPQEFHKSSNQCLVSLDDIEDYRVYLHVGDQRFAVIGEVLSP